MQNGHGLPGRMRWPRTSICSHPSQQAVQLPQLRVVPDCIGLARLRTHRAHCSASPTHSLQGRENRHSRASNGRDSTGSRMNLLCRKVAPSPFCHGRFEIVHTPRAAVRAVRHTSPSSERLGMSAIPPLSGDKQTSGKRGKNDASDPDLNRGWLQRCQLAGRRSEAPVISTGFGKPMSSSTVGAISANRPSASDTLPPSISSKGTGFVV